MDFSMQPALLSLHPRALIVPHAGYQFSGPVAASGYALLRQIRDSIERVVLLGPSHRVPFRGLATTSDGFFATPAWKDLDRSRCNRVGAFASTGRNP